MRLWRKKGVCTEIFGFRVKTCARPYLFYDKYGRVIQTQSNNSLGGTDVSNTEYDFPGKVLKTKTVHQTSAGTVTVKKRFEYDHTGRLVKTYQQNNTDSEIMLAQNTYNELGTLIEKKLHSTNGGSSVLQTVNYAYNIRGWLTKVNDPTNLSGDLFAMELKYESVDADIAGAAQYNGNISQQIWATSTTVRHAYGYSYDQLNQLSSAAYEKYSGGWNQDAARFNESATYDLNGNIMTMVRGGKTGASSYGSMDNITMAYAGNKLIGANDAVTGITGNYQFHEAMVSTVVESHTSTHEYLYDVNGNMVEDKNKGITVVYNYLNLPIQVNFGPNDRIDWTYTATGAKLQKKVYTNGSLTLTQDYVSGFVYKNGSLDFFSTETGRVKNQSGTLKYQYTLTDHLGNTRVMFDDAGTSIEESHYYAFGMRIEGLSTSNPDNKFTYNGKELEDDHGLNWYHYGARFYDAQIGRWHVVDPVDELSSPYLYGKNSPTKFIDPDGKDVTISKVLFDDSKFRNWAESSFSFKLMVGLFGKGGPLEKYNVELQDFKPWPMPIPGQSDVIYDGKPLPMDVYQVDKEGNYSFVMRFNTSSEFMDRPGEAKTGDHEVSHTLYSALMIVKGKQGETAILLTGDLQHEAVPKGTEQSAALFDAILNTLGKDKINLPQGTLEQMKADGFIQIRDDRSGFERLWDGVKAFFGGTDDEK